MPVTHVCSQGDCIASIAEQHGFFPPTIWNDPANQELKDLRGEDGYVLLPGDEVVVPDLTTKDESCATEQRHRFRRKGVPELLKLELVDTDGRPIGGAEYQLDLDGKVIEGTTDSAGKLEHYIPPGARLARLRVPDHELEMLIPLGHLDPVSEITGVQQRLNNLGYACPINGQEDPETAAAVSRFQADHDLEITGEANDATREKLKSEHGS